MKVSNKGIELIKEFESCKLYSYLCPSNVWTIGYGRTYMNGKPVTAGMTCTQAEAEKWLLEDIAIRENYVNDLVTKNLNQNRFDALVSFTFNVGRSPLAADVAPFVNKGDHKTACYNMKLYNKGTVNGQKQTLAGLVRRREAETELYNTPINVVRQYLSVDEVENSSDYNYTMKIKNDRKGAIFKQIGQGKNYGVYARDLKDKDGKSITKIVSKFVKVIREGDDRWYWHEWRPSKDLRSRYGFAEVVYLVYKIEVDYYAS